MQTKGIRLSSGIGLLGYISKISGETLKFQLLCNSCNKVCFYMYKSRNLKNDTEHPTHLFDSSIVSEETLKSYHTKDFRKLSIHYGSLTEGVRYSMRL